MIRIALFALFAIFTISADKLLTPIEARKAVGKTITVRMTVKAAKDRLEKRGEIYLDSEEDFKDEKNFAVVINKDGATDLKKKGIDDPTDHFKNQEIIASGEVKEVDNLPRIEISETKQIKLATDK